MKWTWVGRIFSPAGSKDELQPERDPPWLDPDPAMERHELLVALLGGLGGRSGARSAERIREVVGGLAAADWVRVDESLRWRLYGQYGWNVPQWLKGPESVRRLRLPAGTEAAVLGLLASAPSGYVREAAVQRLALLGCGDELPPLLVRANDWVRPVHTRALDALHARVVPGYAEHWVRALLLVLRLRGTGRTDARPLVDGVLALLRAPESRDAVWTGMHSPERGVRRACFRILLDAGRPRLRSLVRAALASPDEVIRREAAQAAAGLDDGTLDELLPRMLADPFGRVRMAALSLAAERMGAAVLPALRAALLDRGVAIRAMARAAIARLEPMDFAAFYRARVHPDAPRLADAVAGLAETGTAEDADAVAPLLAHARPRVRAAALRALARLAGDAAVPALAGAVGDASPSVSRAAADAVRPRVGRADVAVLAAWFGAGNPVHVRRNALSLLAARGKWDGIAWILQARGDADPEIRDSAGEHLDAWRQTFNRSFSQPTAAQQERIRGALERAGCGIDARTLNWLRFAAGIGA